MFKIEWNLCLDLDPILEIIHYVYVNNTKLKRQTTVIMNSLDKG